jgi:D-alanine--D-alanine ligase
MKKLRIGILMGGTSLEKEVSFNSGRTVCDHLDSTQYAAVPLFQIDSCIYLLPWHFLHRGKTTDFEHRLSTEAQYIPWDDLQQHIDFMFIAQHGSYAEDGCLQGFLEVLDVPYLGSGLLANALRADKYLHKIVLRNAGIDVPLCTIVEPYEIDNFATYQDSIMQRLAEHIPTEQYIVKPCNEGSSLGVSIANQSTLQDALKKACYIESGTKKRVIIEEKIIGMEFTCIVLTDQETGDFFALPPTESVADPAIGFFDYAQKYMPGRGIKRTPARCTPEITERIQQTCIAVMHALGCTIMGRIDGFVQENGAIIIIDPNTFSGLAPSSYIFNQAAEINMTPSQLIHHVIQTSLRKYPMLTRDNIADKNDPLMPTAAKMRIAVLLGGTSNEKETSLDSGRNVFYKLSPHIYDPIAIFINNDGQLYILTHSQLVRNSTHEVEELLHESQKIKWSDLPARVDFVFNALHGGMGENGSIQGALEMLGLPYNGSSVFTSALCMDKYKTNQFLALHGFDVPQHAYITKQEWIQLKEKPFDTIYLAKGFAGRSGRTDRGALTNFFFSSAHPACPINPWPSRECSLSSKKVSTDQDERKNTPLEHSEFLSPFAVSVQQGSAKVNVSKDNPLIVKPHDDGCSVMVQKVTNESELHDAITAIMQHKDAALIEEYVTGMELTGGVIGNDTPRALPISQAVSAAGLLSIEEKFLPGAGENQTPAPLSPQATRLVQDTLERVYQTVQCKGYARIDCFYQTAEQSPTGKERVIILEINTLPGLTPATCLFHQAAEIGLKPMEFIDTIIRLGCEQHTRSTHKKIIAPLFDHVSF